MGTFWVTIFFENVAPSMEMIIKTMENNTDLKLDVKQWKEGVVSENSHCFCVTHPEFSVNVCLQIESDRVSLEYPFMWRQSYLIYAVYVALEDLGGKPIDDGDLPQWTRIKWEDLKKDHKWWQRLPR